MRAKTYVSALARGAWLLLPFLSGCSMGTNLDRPEWARVILTAPSALSVELLVSQKFLVTEGSVQLIESTTDTVTLPFDKTYTLGAPPRFYFWVRNTTQQSVSLHMKVLLEERTWADEDKVVAPGEKVEFIYRYDEPIIY
ncbi:MAG: hypothetical protein Q8N53_03260 [Longimicrobiales bacterium]|nr:hypothetical protein [Longimicrobiales bacterium]